MKFLLIILAVLVMDLRDEYRSPASRRCGCMHKLKSLEKIASAPGENIILMRLQG